MYIKIENVGAVTEVQIHGDDGELSVTVSNRNDRSHELDTVEEGDDEEMGVSRRRFGQILAANIPDDYDDDEEEIKRERMNRGIEEKRRLRSIEEAAKCVYINHSATGLDVPNVSVLRSLIRELGKTLGFDERQAVKPGFSPRCATSEELKGLGLETGWIIEITDGLLPQYWTGRLSWSTKNMDAVRFARQEDARAVADGLLNNIQTTVAEHAWV